MKNYILVFIVLLINGCDFGDNRFTIINKTDKGVYYTYNCDSVLINPPARNGIYKVNKDKERFLYGDYVIADSARKVLIFGPKNGWKKYLNQCNNEIYVFIFQKSIIDSLEWDTIKSNKLYAKCYHLTYSELKKNNWTIIYE